MINNTTKQPDLEEDNQKDLQDPNSELADNQKNLQASNSDHADKQEELNPEKDNKDLPKYLRDLYKKEKQRREKIEQELQAIKQAEEDRTKSAEEKLAEKELKLEQREKQFKQEQARYALEKSLQAQNVDPNLVDLLLEKGTNQIDDDYSNLDDVVEELKNKYSTAFKTPETKPQPIGRVGVSQTTSSTSAMTRDEVERIILDPTIMPSKEVNKLAKEYGLY